MYYGNPASGAQQNAAGVWDSNYQGVWHLGNGTALSTADSTGNANNGINTNAVSDSSPKAWWQLIKPRLPNLKPASVHLALNKLLTAPSGPIYTGHHAQQHRPLTRPRYLGRDGPPCRVVSRVETCMPYRSQVSRVLNLEEHDFFFRRRIPGIGAPRAIRSGKN